MKKILSISFLFFLTLTAFAQDKHFSQFYASPLTLNPAFTGFIDGKYRVAMIYRRQWQALASDPYITFAGAFDMRFRLGQNSKKKDAIGGGLVFYSDKAGISEFTTNTMALSGAFHKALDMEGSQYLSAGFEMGLSQRSVNYAGLTFEDQYDGSGYVSASDEVLPRNNFTYSDIATGIFYAISPEDRQAFNIGLSLYHATRPNMAFEDEAKSRLWMRISGQVGGQFPVHRKVDFMPRAIVLWQGPHLEINGGANLKFLLNEYNKTRMYAGLWVRGAGDAASGAGIDAVILSTAFQVEGLQLGLSYDVNVSPLLKATNGRGGFEISVSYTGSYEDDTVICPSF